ncbi:hypothetical protein [Paenibacillus sp. Marseille-Q4541]|uniref:hypothetical protein n=1 Tax=Paenibacillus sp. Marseille-Q4541 TaxID=2831522 RepID=UPI001BAABCE4|nr:hypothetical protein [Paenibacillus sp. Marseille-Q4541]
MQSNDSYYKSETEKAPGAPVVSVKSWMLTIFLLAIPIVNIILLFVWGFGNNTNPSKANYAKASLLWMAIVLAIYLIIFIITITTSLS